MLRFCRQLLLLVLFLLCAVWVSGEAYQWLLRWRAEKLLSDVRTLQVNRSGWQDAQLLMARWAKWGTSSPICSAESCTYRIDIVQALPQTLGGTPDKGAKNWLPKLAGHLGLRGGAARAEFIVKHGAVVSRTFGEQVTLPVQDWNLSVDYIPYLTASSGVAANFHEHIPDSNPLHPTRKVLVYPNGLVVNFAPDEEPSEQALLMDFRFSCITQLRPCRSAGDMLPEGQRMLQEKQHQAGTR